MRKISIDNLKVGLIIGKPIYTESGAILINENIRLTSKLIDKIKLLDLKYVYIIEEKNNITKQEIISEKTKIETIKALEKSINKIKEGHFNVTWDIISKVKNIIEEVTKEPKIIVKVEEIRTKDEYLQMHSINVCIISLIIAKKLNYDNNRLRHLAIGALLHDLGKTKVDNNFSKYRSVYNKSELEIYEKHTKIGYKLVTEIPGSSQLSANVALTHHEHYDGTGFPFGKKASDIHEFSRIVAVANEYDNLLYNLPKEIKLKNYEIIELIISRAYSWFDPNIIKVFKESINPFPKGSKVILSDKREGIVEGFNEGFPTRPIIKVIDPNLLEEEIIDLSTNNKIIITHHE